MSGQQLIIDKIIREAEQNSQNIIESAQKEAELIINLAREVNQNVSLAYLEKAKKEAENIVSAKHRECQLEARRKKLSLRYSALNEAFSRAKKLLLSLDDESYLNYIKRCIRQYAQNGDSIIISARDQKRISKGFVGAIAKELGIELTLCGECGDFDGGIIIKSKYWDCNLTIEDNFRFFREEFESSVAKILSGDIVNE